MIKCKFCWWLFLISITLIGAILLSKAITFLSAVFELDPVVVAICAVAVLVHLDSDSE